MTTATSEKKKTTTVTSFGVEADTPRNGDLILGTGSLRNKRLRGALDATKTTVANHMSEDNTPVVPRSQMAGIGQLPKVPGMQIHVNPVKLSYKIIDPLFDNEELCEKIVRSLKQSDVLWKPDKVRGNPPESGTLDVHEMKTLVRELVWLVESDHAKPALGSVPSLEDVDGLPGKYLQNAGSPSFQQPRYEEDMPDWVDRLTKTGM